jgi:hypothetical protein
MKHNSKLVFAACEQQARIVIRFYRHYRNIIDSLGSDVHRWPVVTQQHIYFIILGFLCSFGLFFITQGEYFQGRNLLKPVLPNLWLSVVIVFLACGFIGSCIVIEFLPQLRIFTLSEDASQSGVRSRIDQLVDKIRGTVHRERLHWSVLARRYGLAFIAMCFAAIAGVAIWRALAEGNWLYAILPPFFFILDIVIGIGPVWLLGFFINWVFRRFERYQADRALNNLEREWNMVVELIRLIGL